jgi:hypothetical protein
LAVGQKARSVKCFHSGIDGHIVLMTDRSSIFVGEGKKTKVVGTGYLEGRTGAVIGRVVHIAGGSVRASAVRRRRARGCEIRVGTQEKESMRRRGRRPRAHRR